MKIKILLLVPVALVLFNSCSVLTKSQVKNINAFATSAKKYSNFPGEIIRQRAELVLEEKLVGSIKLQPDQIKKSIATARENYASQLVLADKFDVSLKLIRQYSSLLTKLSSDKFVEDLTTNTNELDDNLGNLVKTANTTLTNKIPVNVGSVITKAIFLAGEKLTKNRQAEILKEFISTGDTLIQITTTNLVDALSTELPALMASDKEKFINTYTNFILGDPGKVDYNSLKQYLTGLDNYDNLEELRKLCIKAANKLSKAHSKLNASIRAKSDIKEIFEETQDLIMSIQDIYKTYSKLSSVEQS